MNLEDLWRAALAEIEINISRPNFVTWLTGSRLLGREEGVARVALSNNFSKEWVENRYATVILGALRNIDETTKKVEFVVAPGNRAPQQKADHAYIKTDDIGQLSFTEFKIDPETNLNPRYTLNSFIVGKSNELAYAATQSIVQEIGKKYNPLFIYGGVGLGKTHLIQSVGNEIHTRYHGKVKVKYVSSEKFTNDVIWAIRNKRMETMKEKYRLIDVLIIDDVQFIAGKAATEEEFFHTFNALYENNKQIIISSDRAPKFIPTLEERLRSRFEGGMIADIGYPDYELRCAIIRTKGEEKGLALTDHMRDFIASKIQKSIRELEGVLNKIIFHQSHQNEPLTLKLVEEVVNECIERPIKNINPNHIIKTVAELYEISPFDLMNRSRKKEIAEARQITMYLLRDILSLSYPYIGKKLGKRDHTTAIYAFEKVSQEITKNQNFNQKIITLKEMIMRE